MKKALVIGGANGIGLSIATELAARYDMEKVYIVDKASVMEEYMKPKFEVYQFDLTQEDYSLFDCFQDIDTLMITAGFGRIALFENIEEYMLPLYFNVNTIPVLRIIKRFYNKLQSHEDFYCGVMVSIAGFMSSPFFSVYGATKAALKIFIESINVELLKAGFSNQILNVSPGSIRGTSFNNDKTELPITRELSQDIISHLEAKDDLFIPKYNEIYKEVLRRYHDDFRKEGAHSYDYKINTGRVK